jgi:hypothetical protein
MKNQYRFYSLITIIVGLIITFFIWFTDFFQFPILLHVVEIASTNSLLKLLYTLVLFFILSISFYIILKIKINHRLKSRFGILWDNKNKPHCPVCKTLLSYSEANPKYPCFFCDNCKDHMFLTDEYGNIIKLFQARELLRQ